VGGAARGTSAGPVRPSVAARAPGGKSTGMSAAGAPATGDHGAGGSRAGGPDDGCDVDPQAPARQRQRRPGSDELGAAQRAHTSW
jgi:hypothetical protein